MKVAHAHTHTHRHTHTHIHTHNKMPNIKVFLGPYADFGRESRLYKTSATFADQRKSRHPKDSRAYNRGKLKVNEPIECKIRLPKSRMNNSWIIKKCKR